MGGTWQQGSESLGPRERVASGPEEKPRALCKEASEQVDGEQRWGWHRVWGAGREGAAQGRPGWAQG